MDSKSSSIANEVIRHYKEGQILSWIGDEETAIKEFDKSVRAVNHLEKINPEYAMMFVSLKKLAAITPLKKDSRTNEAERERMQLIRKKENIPFEKKVKVTYSLTVIGENRLELRARIYLPWSKLVVLARKKGEINRKETVNDRSWAWISVNNEWSYTASFLLTFSDGTVFASITTHSYLQHDQVKDLGEKILEALHQKIND
ncbi:hypothetical protein [Rossellomorea vietnamensis]|uniref:Uncharacterized protein n=1 Tax=Rossellomorea vietnamensis TaxID=218284 RepID=A0A0P6WN59_9BACI|nr:hypothetical protein [Rossellomorea vietnamensis]KPL57648.1 hypothetical protein AM506_21025 [Rossellomorea vietnamensis]